ncbi:hypothetical protein ACIBEJ_30460 [Nonomuraea sp. NPDC050790]|uniref:hypothetical protein n=1 Tax=Nonomuraea sp. NPDC050790 TaxID=3364371 RepID=UPI0037ABDDC4
MDSTTLRAAARRFPLVGWARLACPPLRDRVAEIVGIAEAAERHGADRLHEGAHALNKAALVASDCGLPELAKDLCWQHINIYREAGHPLTARQARYMLEPVHNLARLQIRADAGKHAMRLLDAMYRAIMQCTELAVEGRTLPLAGLTGPQEERHKLREWAWRQYVADGIRTLTLAGRWDEAVTHAKANRGVGDHLMEGRQAVIVANCLRGATQAAQDVLEESTITQPWEQQVAACLTVLCRLAGDRPSHQETDVMIERYLASRPAPPGHAVFQARLGLAVVELVSRTAPAKSGPAYTRLIGDALAAADGYVARELLAHSGCAAMLIRAEKTALTTAVQAAGLGLGAIPGPLMADLLTAVRIAETAIERALSPSTSATAGRRSP